MKKTVLAAVFAALTISSASALPMMQNSGLKISGDSPVVEAKAGVRKARRQARVQRRAARKEHRQAKREARKERRANRQENRKARIESKLELLD